MKKLKKVLTILLVAVFVSTGLTFTNVKVKAASGQSIVNYAKTFFGVPYVWGGTSPSGFDCSGLVQYVYNHFGISLPRTSQEQQNVGKYVSRSSLQPGDLVFFGNPAHHVGIYAGGGRFIEAPHTGANVRYGYLSNRSDFSGGRRISGISNSNSYIKIDGGGCGNVNGSTGMNLIVRDFSSDVVRAFAWVDSDKEPSWSFDVTPPNSNYTKLYKNTNKVITVRNGGSHFTAGATYRIKIKGYNKDHKIVCEDTISLKVPKTNSSIKIDGGGTLSHDGTSGMNLIIRNYSSDVVRAFGWVDNDKEPSWSFDVTPPNSNYTRLYNNTSKVVTVRNGGSHFTPGGTYRMKVKGYNRDYKVVCEDTITLKVPNGITNPNAKPIYSGSFTVKSNVQAKECPYDSAKATRSLHTGDKVDVYAEYGDWYLVARGTPQWVKKSYLTK